MIAVMRRGAGPFHINENESRQLSRVRQFYIAIVRQFDKQSHEKEIAKVVANKDVYTNIANSSWKKEDELRSLKSEAAELDRKIALTISTNKEAKGDVEQDNSISISGLPNQIDNKQSKIHEDSEDGRSQGFRPKWRH